MNVKKKLISLILALCMVFAILPVVGLAGTDNVNESDKAFAVTGGSIYYRVWDGEITITGADETITAAVMPFNIDGKPVTDIGSSAFGNCTGLTSVSIPSSVTYIGHYAFENCTGLTSVNIPSSVTTIERYAFSGCTGLTSVSIPSGVTSISCYAFEGCSGLTSINVSEFNSVYSSDEGVVFTKDKKGLILFPEGICGEYTIPEGVTSIGEAAFTDCIGLTSVTMPEGVTSMGWSAFAGCTGLTSVRIPSSLTRISVGAFASCSGLTSVTIPEGVTSIDGHAFDGCSSLTSVDIPSGMMYVNEWAFKGCSGLTSVTIPEGVTFIGGNTFEGCSGLTSVYIPLSLTYIGSGVFNGCYSLTDIYYAGTEEQWKKIKGIASEYGYAAIRYNYDPNARTDYATGERIAFQCEGDTLTVSGDVSPASPVYIALYDADGRMTAVYVLDAPGSVDVGGGATAKLIWMNAAGFTPKSECVEFELE